MAKTEVTGAQIKDQSVDLAVDATGTLPVGNGGTGSTTFALNNVLLGNGTGALQAVSPGTTGNVLTSDGTTWSSSAPSATGSTTATADTLAQRDSAGNLYADNFISTATSTATAAGTTTMTIDSTRVQAFTGTTTQTVLLPTTGVVAGQVYTIINQSSGSVTVQSSAAATICTLTSGRADFAALVNTPTTAANWRAITWPASSAPLVTTGNSLAALQTSTTNTIGVGTIELGHASDTTLSRSAAGVLAVEGVPVVAVAPGTTGNVLTSNGSTWTSAAPTGGGGSARVTSTVTSATTLAAVAGTQYLAYIAAGGSVTLPTAVGNTSSYIIKNIDTAAKTIVTVGNDANFGSVTTLLRGNGDDASTVITDSSAKYNWTPAAGVRLSTAVKKFGTASISFGAGGNNAAVKSVSDLFPGMGTSDFTIEMWFYSTVAGQYFLYDTRPYATNGVYTTLYVTSGNKLAFLVSAADRITSTTNVTTNTWHHAAVTRSGGVTKLFLNGVQEGSNYTDTNNYLTGAVCLGNTGAVIYGVWQGYLDDIRITQGVGRYTANFTAPTAEHPIPELIDGAYPFVLAPNQAVEVASGGNNWSVVSDAAALPTLTSTPTSASITTLTAASSPIQVFTGTTTHTVRLPSTGIIAGRQFTVINNSTGLLTMQTSTAAQIHVLASGTESILTALIDSPTTAAHWEDSFIATNFAAGKALTVNNSLTLAGTDATTMTFPTTNAVIARTDAAQTFTGVQTMTSPALTTPVINGTPTGTGVAVAGTANTLVLRDGSGTIVSSLTETTTALGTIGAAVTLTLAGMVQTATLTSATPCTVTMPAVSNGASFVLYLRQPATGTPTTATFTNVRFGTGGAPVITAVLGRMDILTFFSDGVNWYGQYAQGYQY